MKQLSIAITLLILTSCQNNDGGEGKHDHQEAGQHQTTSNDSAIHMNGLELNDGKKWISDESTYRNVEDLRQVLQRFGNKKDPVLEDYHLVAGELENGINTLVKQCRMKGPDHDALHSWLEPLIGNVKELKKNNNVEEASAKLKEINRRLNDFSTYFALA